MTFYKFAIAVTAAASLSFSCHREEFAPETDAPDGIELTFGSDSAIVTKTEWDGETIQWSAGDKISVGYTVSGVWSDDLYESDALAQTTSKARFLVRTDLTGLESGALGFYGLYPSSAVSAGFADAPVVKVMVPSEQTVTGKTYDPTADIMIARSLDGYCDVSADFIPLLWTRLVSHAEISLTNISLEEGERLVSVELTADEQASIAGEFSVDLVTGEFNKTSAVSNVLSIDVSASSVDASGSLEVWAAFMPCEWKSLKVGLITSKRKYVRNLGTCSLDFVANRRHTLAVDMSSAFGEAINADVFDLLDLDYPGLEQVKANYLAEDYQAAAAALVDYYRTRSVANPEEVLSERRMYAEDRRIAEQALEHRFCVRRGYWYESLNGTEYTYYDFDDADGEINWSFDLPGAGQENYQKHWHQWFKYLAWAQYLTGDDKYIECWKDVYGDWLETFPAPEGKVDLWTYKDRSWHQLSMAARISNQLADFPYFITSKAFTGSWMSTFLVEFHKLVELCRANPYYEATSNIRFAQYTAQANASVLFPEFKKASEWLDEVAPEISSQFSLQFYEDGVHNEMAPNYQLGVMDNFRAIYNIARANDRLDAFDPEYADKMRESALFLANYVWPDYTWEWFNDTFEQTRNVLLNNIKRYSAMFPDENLLKYLASERKEGTVPTESLISFPVGGYYVLRSGWDGNESMFILKNNYNPLNRYHCHMDNGTFALWSKGRNFLPDAGVYSYGGTDELDALRQQHLATSSHNTLTKNLATIANNHSKGQCLLTRTSASEDLVVTQNASYSDLTHRRAVYMLDKEFYVVVDEAFGNAAPCEVNLSFHLCEGTVVTDDYSSSCAYGVHTEFQDGNDMLLRTYSETVSGFVAETGTSSCSYKMNEAYDRTFYRVTVDKSSSSDVVRFITVICPSRSAEISASFVSGFSESGSSVKVSVNGKEYSLSYTLQ